MYSGTRFSIERQLAPMQIGIRKAVRTISSKRDAVDAERPIDAAAERHLLDELPLRAVRIVLRPQIDAEREVDQRGDQRDPARAARA